MSSDFMVGFAWGAAVMGLILMLELLSALIGGNG